MYVDVYKLNEEEIVKLLRFMFVWGKLNYAELVKLHDIVLKKV